MQDNKTSRVDTEVDFVELLKNILFKVPMVILSSAAVMMIALLISMLFMTPTYVTSAKMFIMPDQDENRVAMSSQLQAGAMLTSDYLDIIQSREVADDVISRLNLVSANGTSVRSSFVTSRVRASSTGEGRIITITCSDTDPYRAAELANAVFEASVERISEVAGAVNVSLVDKAEIPLVRSSPNITRNAFVGAAIGALIAIILTVVSFISNDTVNSSEDVEKYLGLSTLGVIPRSAHLGGDVGKGKKKKK